MSLFDERIPYKPFEYPVYYTDGWLLQAQAFWLHTEIPMQGDVKDWNENLSVSEKNLVGNILLGFAQTECAVSDYWTTMVTHWFPKHEIKQMAIMFGSQETIHATAYSYLNETLGLEDFEAFLHEPATAEKFDLLIQTKAEYNHEDLKWSKEAREDVARSLAIFSAFAEGVSLYSSFAVLYSFQMRNLLKGIGQQMKWSVRDESLHSKMGCQLFRHMCDEFPGLKTDVRDSVIEAAELIVKLEENFIEVFTTRIDTIFSGTFLILAPGHNFIDKNKTKIENIEEVFRYREQAKMISDTERVKEEKEITLSSLVKILNKALELNT
jgi:ribonucleoside-diphosphate reductase beta chain